MQRTATERRLENRLIQAQRRATRKLKEAISPMEHFDQSLVSEVSAEFDGMLRSQQTPPIEITEGESYNKFQNLKILKRSTLKNYDMQKLNKMIQKIKTDEILF